ncbi:hypothetical protein CL176_00340 [Suicoccus acidiformans]|uniref:DUF5067 domain-containing protein n=1 Tax=Suicoccus acidiformans TaxID=2036206 RepID=A0A347WHP1_9LACT|nr:hypothetical protein [Suicoccus acidiformans]AXY24598.1 hypothetical protein CL176_00340 [Suicoccus acidiformans]
MKRILKAVLFALLCLSIHGAAYAADDHHQHGGGRASFIPQAILNPDDSKYVAPQATENYIGTYTAETEIPALNVTVHLITEVSEDGLFNLAYYFEPAGEKAGLRFYAKNAETIESRPAIYQDLVVMTGALREGDGGLGTGLIGKTISPVVLLDESGEPEQLYPFMALAYDLRETYTNARVYQNTGLYFVDGEVLADINHMIGLEDGEQITVTFEKVDGNHADALLVDKRVYEILQESFDHYLIDHNDFAMDFTSANQFVQEVLAMHLETNRSFPADTKVDLLPAEAIMWTEAGEVEYSMLINDEILYVYVDGELYVTDAFTEGDGRYSSKEWTGQS